MLKKKLNNEANADEHFGYSNHPYFKFPIPPGGLKNGAGDPSEHLRQKGNNYSCRKTPLFSHITTAAFPFSGIIFVLSIEFKIN